MQHNLKISKTLLSCAMFAVGIMTERTKGYLALGVGLPCMSPIQYHQT